MVFLFALVPASPLWADLVDSERRKGRYEPQTRLVKLPPREKMRRGGIIGICDFVDCVTKHRSKWFAGPYGFVLRNAKAQRLEPMKGRLNLWNYPP